jgi:hypothetical protein
MEHGIKLIDFETVDQMVQIHGTCRFTFATHNTDMCTVDYEGVGINSRTSNSKGCPV